MSKKNNWKRFSSWVSGGESDPLEKKLSSEEEIRDGVSSYSSKKEKLYSLLEAFPENRQKVEKLELKSFDRLYKALCMVVCAVLIFVLILTVAYLPCFGGANNPDNNEVSQRYIENGVEETGAINLVAGMILDYRAFDTLGESCVLFTAVTCVFVLMKSLSSERTIPLTIDVMFDMSRDVILHKVVTFLFPVIMLFGVYILLNGHLGPGGGFAGGAVMGAGLMLYSLAFGEEKTERMFSEKTFKVVSCSALSFYCLSKSYSFFTGANHLESFIPKGIAGNILSGGLILPLNICVGFVVACTMYGFYTLFRKGGI